MTGKEKCEFLKEICKNMAKENGISYEPRECHHEGDCTGTCPLCEKEAAELLAELKNKEKNGEKIQIDTEAIKVLEQISDRSEEIANEEEVELLGDIPSDFFEKTSLSDEKKRLEIERLIREEGEREAMETSGKEGFWRKIRRKIRDFIAPHPMGIIDDEDEICEYTQDDKTPLMGYIPSERLIPKEPEPEPEPDIVWNLDGEEETVISPLANIVDNDNGSATENDNPVILDKTDTEPDITEPVKYFMVCVDGITIYISIQDDEECWIVKRHIDGVDVIFEDKWREFYDRALPYLEKAKEISEEDFIKVKNSMTEIPRYIETRDKRGECCYLRMCAEDGTAYYEFKHNHPLRGVLADGWDGDVHKTKFDRIDGRSYEGIIASISVNGAGSNILSKLEFEEWWKRGR